MYRPGDWAMVIGRAAPRQRGDGGARVPIYCGHAVSRALSASETGAVAIYVFMAIVWLAHGQSVPRGRVLLCAARGCWTLRNVGRPLRVLCGPMTRVDCIETRRDSTSRPVSL